MSIQWNVATATGLSEDTDTYPLDKAVRVKLRDAGGRGDCFYFTLYEAMKEKDLLDGLTVTYPELRGTKRVFVQAFRTLVADHCDEEYTRMYMEMCRTKRQYPETFLELLDWKRSSFPTWLTHISKTYIQSKSCSKEHLQMFLHAVKQSIRISSSRLDKEGGSYTSELDVQIAKGILQRAGIYLEIKHHEFRTLMDVPNRIVLINQGESHYQYFSFASATSKPASVSQSGPPRYSKSETSYSNLQKRMKTVLGTSRPNTVKQTKGGNRTTRKLRR